MPPPAFSPAPYAHLKKWVPGQSGNPLGNNVHKVQLATRIRQLSKSGDEMVAFLFAIMRGESLPRPGTEARNAMGRPPRPTVDQRMRATELLLAYAFGKPKETVDLHQGDAATRQERLTLIASMSEEDRATLKAMFQKAIEARNRAAPVEASSSVSRGETGRAAAPDAPPGPALTPSD